MTITINIESVAFKAQGYESSVDVARLHDDARIAVFEYGLRRWVQDRTNSEAKKARDDYAKEHDLDDEAMKEVDVAEYFDASAFVRGIIEDLESGKITNRGACMTDVEKVAHQLARADWLATLSGDKKKKAAKLLMGEIREQMAKIVAADPEGYYKRAEAEIERRKRLPAEKARNAKRAAEAVNKAGLDLDALLK